ncbi:MAG: hypothetical protein JW923_01720 [Spirochaetales bacterium]|nr:hypothetical protein [Spirochaetales bacterium]
MGVKIRILGAVLVLSVLSLAYAQDGSGADAYEPYPSHIRIGVRNDVIVVSWDDSDDIELGYVVYRQLSEPSAGSFAEAVPIGQVQAGVGQLEYRPPDDRAYYYFVLGRSETGVHQVFIPLRNVSLVGMPAPGAPEYAESPQEEPASEVALTEPVQPSPEPPSQPEVPEPGSVDAPPAQLTEAVPESPATETEPVAPEPTTPTPPEPSATASSAPEPSVRARRDGEGILVEFPPDAQGGRMIVYRATQKISSVASLLSASVASLSEPGVGSFNDLPVPGNDYYYAAVPERDLVAGTVSIKPGHNATTEPVSLESAEYRVALPEAGPESRSLPLPLVVVRKSLEDSSEVIGDPIAPDEADIDRATRDAIQILSGLSAPAQAPSSPRFIVFQRDLEPGGGEEFALRAIVADYLMNGRYSEGARQLGLYLSLPRSPENTALARFYRGQALALTGSYQEAFYDLVRARDDYYQETQAWIEYVLAKLASNGG